LRVDPVSAELVENICRVKSFQSYKEEANQVWVSGKHGNEHTSYNQYMVKQISFSDLTPKIKENNTYTVSKINKLFLYLRV